MDTTLLQPYELTVFLYGGLILGILLEINALLCRLSPNRFFVHGLDLLLVALSFVVIALTFYKANGGEFRLFGILFILFGILLIHGSLGQILPRPAPIKLYRRNSPML